MNEIREDKPQLERVEECVEGCVAKCVEEGVERRGACRQQLRRISSASPGPASFSGKHSSPEKDLLSSVKVKCPSWARIIVKEGRVTRMN